MWYTNFKADANRSNKRSFCFHLAYPVKKGWEKKHSLASPMKMIGGKESFAFSTKRTRNKRKKRRTFGRTIWPIPFLYLEHRKKNNISHLIHLYFSFVSCFDGQIHLDFVCSSVVLVENTFSMACKWLFHTFFKQQYTFHCFFSFSFDSRLFWTFAFYSLFGFTQTASDFQLHFAYTIKLVLRNSQNYIACTNLCRRLFMNYDYRRVLN